MQGLPFVIVFIVAIAVMIFSISRWKIHPFLSIMSVSLFLAFAAGVPLVDIRDVSGKISEYGIVSVIGQGFSSTFMSIGIVIILGALIGSILASTGAAVKLADTVIRVIGPKYPQFAIMMMGWVVSIPVFCDSGFVILDPIRKALAKKTAVSSVAMTVCLSAGLYASHVLIPPTPGPIAAANTLGLGNNLLLIMGIGTIVSIPALIGSYIYASFIGKRVKSQEDIEDDGNEMTYDEIIASYGKLPNAVVSFAPIVVPIILMAIGSIVSMISLSGFPAQLALFLGAPIIALTVGLLCGIALIMSVKQSKRLFSLTNETLKTVGPILFVTAAGGVLGKVIVSSGMVQYISSNSDVLQTVGIFFPFILSAVLKSAQGSSTVAITTTAGLMLPLMPTLGLTSPILGALTISAIGAGAMTVSHANDSYFWVVTNFGGLTTEDGYKTQTMVTLVEGLCAMAGIFVLYLILK